MAYLSIPNWEKLQHYKNRAPPWIKLHNQLLENYEFECLPDASKAHLICIWLLASRTNNRINPDPSWIKRRIGANSKVDVKLLIDKKFIVLNQEVQGMEQDASKTLALACSREESRGEESRGEKPLSDLPDERVREVFDFWCEVMKKTSRTKLIANRRNAIKARLKDGYTVDEIKQAITNCSLSSFHMGPDGTGKYNDLELICRTKKFENFRDNVGKNESAKGAGITKGHDNGYDEVDYQSDSTKDEDMPEWIQS